MLNLDDLNPEQHNQLEKAHRFLQLLGQSERNIVTLAVEGYSDQKIALRLCISEHTVRRHVENIQNKTPSIYGRKLKFRQQLVPALAPYLFLCQDMVQNWALQLDNDA
ncbi:MAG: helix-turn-helix transcriptional regulator [Oscillochloris sp.]|nr:helix-turn-helix transcriptional regulator [Oscillochloris sp.]